MNISRKTSKAKPQIKDDFSINEDESMDLHTFSDGDAKIEGTLLKSFSFNSDEEPIEHSVCYPSTSHSPEIDLTVNETSIKPSAEQTLTSNTNSINSNNQNDILDNRTLKSNPNGRTPAVNGEPFDMVRCYTLRRSTIRILSKIKAIHSDDNVYLNTIVDEAIRYYYEYLKNSNM